MGDHTNPAFSPDDAGTHRTTSSNGFNDDKNSFPNTHPIEMTNLSKAQEALKDYDPFLHRKVNHPTTNAETLLHFLKGCLGTGILAMPKAFYHSGYVVGTIATVLIGAICTYSIHMLIRAEYELCKRRKVPSLTYHELAEIAFEEGPPKAQRFSTYAKHTVNIFLLIYQLGICCVYVVFIGTNVKSVCDEYLPNVSVSIYMLIFLLPLILINWVRNLKRLAPFCTVANVVTLFGYAIIFYYIIKQKPTISDRSPTGQYDHFPLFLGTVLFSLEAIGVIMPLENEMKTPKFFARPFGVLNIGMGLVVGFYLTMGLLGYLSYGDKIEAAITLNLPDKDILAQVVKITLSLSIYVTHALQCYVAVDIIWNEYIGPKLEKGNRALLWEYVMRTTVVVATFLLAVAIPKLDLFISLFGALCLSVVGIALPAGIDSFTFWYSRKGSYFYFTAAKNILLILFGVAGLVSGTYSSLKAIIEEML